MIKQKFISILLILVFYSFISFAQERVILRPNGETISLDKSKNLREAIKVSKLKTFQGEQTKHSFPQLDFSAIGKADTLNYTDYGSFNTNFGFWAQDVMMQWFVTPADMTIKAAGFSCSDDEGAANASVSLRLINLNWTEEQLKAFSSTAYPGYYPSDGDGFNNADFFGEEATGDWISKDINNPLPPWTDNADPVSNGWDYDLWNSYSFWPIVPEEQDGPGSYQWVEMMSEGFEPELKAGDIFGVVVMHNGINLDEDRIGFYAVNTIGYPGWKYYENGRLSSDDPGWWVRMYTWDFAVAVDITGDTPPKIEILTYLYTSLITGPFPIRARIIDENPSGGDTGVAFAELVSVVDNFDTTRSEMVHIGNDIYEGIIEKKNPGDYIQYWVEAEDVNGNRSRSEVWKYYIFNPNPEAWALLVFNGFQEPNGYPQDYYFIALEWLFYDVWSYGPLTTELVNNYESIIEITTKGPTAINNDVIRTWLNTGGYKNYTLCGDEWLGAQSGFIDKIYAPGDFQYDILGIAADYNDINYANPGDQNLPSVVIPIEGSLLGDNLLLMYNQVKADSGWKAPMLYDPSLENWLDGVDFLDDVEVDMIGVGIDGNSYNIAGHRTLAPGNKIAFLAYDPLSLYSQLEDGSQYFWYGILPEAPHNQAVMWFGYMPPSVDDNNSLHSYWISQNFPNPFNPSTIIKYRVPERSFVTLRVFDILGNEITTLVNEEKEIGEYQVEFGNRNLSSGVYFYSFRAGNYINAKKMILLR